MMNRSQLIGLALVSTTIISCASVNIDSSPCAKAYYYGNYSDAIPICLESAIAGNAQSQLYLAQMYYNGLGVHNLNKAIHWYQEAAKNGNPDAEFFVGYMYGHGTLMETESQRAANWYRKAAAQGNYLASTQMAWRYSVGLDDRGLVHNEFGLNDNGLVNNSPANPYAVESNNWYKKAISQARKKIAQDIRNANAGDAGSQCELADFYNDGININNQDVLLADPLKSRYWAKTAAAQGATCGEYRLGLNTLYSWTESSNQVKPSVAQIQYGISLLTKAADKGNLNAMDSLGLLYSDGWQLIPNDKNKARGYFTRAAKLGNPDSQYHLADLYYYGQGITRDTCEAYRWYNAAANQATKDDYLSIQAISRALSLYMGYMNAHKSCKYLNQ